MEPIGSIRHEIVQDGDDLLLHVYLPEGIATEDIELSFSTTSKGQVAVHLDDVARNLSVGNIVIEGHTLAPDANAKYKKAKRRYTIRLLKSPSSNHGAAANGNEPQPLADDDVAEDTFHDAHSDLDMESASGPEPESSGLPQAVGSQDDGNDEQDDENDGMADMDPEERKAIRKERKKAKKAMKRAAKSELAQEQQQQKQQDAAAAAASQAGEAAAVAAAGASETAAKKKRKKKKSAAAAAQPGEAGNEETGEQEAGTEVDITGLISMAAVYEESQQPSATSATSAPMPAPAEEPAAADYSDRPPTPATTPVLQHGRASNKAIHVNMEEDFEENPVAQTNLNAPAAAPDSMNLNGPFMKFAHTKSDFKGEDKSLQAATNTWTLPSVDGTTHFSAFGVFDGHGGKSAPVYVSKNLLPLVGSYLDRCKGPEPEVIPPPSTTTVKIGQEQCATWAAQEAMVDRLPKAMHAAFVEVDSVCMQRCKQSGTTATLAVTVGWELLVANVGDSLAYLDTGAEIIQVSGNHRVGESEEELERVKQMGGHIAQSDIDGVIGGPLRVWPGGLMMTRSLGDHSAGDLCLCEPEVRQITLPPNGARLFIASDGLWDAVQHKNIIANVRKMPAGQAVNVAVHAAIKKKGLNDDITVIIVDFCTSPDDRIPPALEAVITGRKRDCQETTHVLRPLDCPSNSWKSLLAQRRAFIIAQHDAEQERLAQEAAAKAAAAGPPGGSSNARQPLSETYRELAELRVDLGSLSLEPEGKEDEGEWQTVGPSRQDVKPEYAKELQAAARPLVEGARKQGHGRDRLREKRREHREGGEQEAGQQDRPARERRPRETKEERLERQRLKREAEQQQQQGPEGEVVAPAAAAEAPAAEASRKEPRGERGPRGGRGYAGQERQQKEASGEQHTHQEGPRQHQQHGRRAPHPAHAADAAQHPPAEGAGDVGPQQQQQRPPRQGRERAPRNPEQQQEGQHQQQQQRQRPPRTERRRSGSRGDGAGAPSPGPQRTAEPRTAAPPRFLCVPSSMLGRKPEPAAAGQQVAAGAAAGMPSARVPAADAPVGPGGRGDGRGRGGRGARPPPAAAAPALQAGAAVAPAAYSGFGNDFGAGFGGSAAAAGDAGAAAAFVPQEQGGRGGGNGGRRGGGGGGRGGGRGRGERGPPAPQPVAA